MHKKRLVCPSGDATSRDFGNSQLLAVGNHRSRPAFRSISPMFAVACPDWLHHRYFRNGSIRPVQEAGDRVFQEWGVLASPPLPAAQARPPSSLQRSGRRILPVTRSPARDLDCRNRMRPFSGLPSPAVPTSLLPSHEPGLAPSPSRSTHAMDVGQAPSIGPFLKYRDCRICVRCSARAGGTGEAVLPGEFNPISRAPCVSNHWSKPFSTKRVGAGEQ